LLTGDWDKAEESFTSLDEPSTLPYSAVLLRAFRGDLEGVDALLPANEQVWLETEEPQEIAVAATALAAAATCAGEHSRILTHAQRALSHADALGLRNEGVRWAWPLAGDAALALGELTLVEHLIQWLDDHPLGQVPAVLRAESLRVKAKLLVARNDPHADAAFEDAIRAFRELKSPYHLAVGLLDQAQHAVSTDPGASQQLAAEADAIARRLGADPLRKRAQALLIDGSASVPAKPIQLVQPRA
jgi:hypothetical protein